MSDEQTKLLADAFQAVTEVLRKIHSEFKFIVMAMVFLLISTIVGSTWAILRDNSNTEDRLGQRQEKMLYQLKELTERLHINQNVNIGAPRTIEDNARDILKQQGHIQ